MVGQAPWRKWRSLAVESWWIPWESSETSWGPGREVIFAALIIVAWSGGRRTSSVEMLKVTDLMLWLETGSR